MHIRVLNGDEEIAAAFDLAYELRPNLQRETFLDTVRAQQAEGYLLAGGLVDGELVTLAGYRFSRTLFRGLHLFVDDLVTTSSAQKRGYATIMLAWLGALADAHGVEDVYLDSRFTARGFYEQVGFELKNAIPCRMNAKALAAKSVKP